MKVTEEQVKQVFEEFDRYLMSCLVGIEDPRHHASLHLMCLDSFRRGYSAAHKLHDPEDYERQINGTI